MANMRVITSLLTYTPSADSFDGNYPAANVAVYATLLRAWKASVSSGIVNLTLDFGSGNTLSGLAANPGILIDDVNVTSARIQGNSTPSWSSPPWDQPITIAQEQAVGRYKDFRRLLDLSASAFAYRYLNIRIPSQTSTDGGNYRISRVMVGNITELSVNPANKIERTREEATLDTKLLDGGMEVNAMGEPYMMFAFPRPLPSTTALDEQRAIDAIGRGTPFVFWDAALGGTQDGWLVRRTAASKISQEFLSSFQTTWSCQEVI